MFGAYRFLLALNVAFFHLADVPAIGPFAVFSFFVLSGYLMTAVMHGSYSYTPNGFARFWTNRFLRLFPFYWITVAVTLGVIVLVTGERYASDFHPALSVPDSFGEWAQNLTLVFWAERPISVTPRLSPAAWALTIELFFYLLISLGLSRNLWTTLFWFAGSSAYAGYQLLANKAGLTYGTLVSASLPFASGALMYHFRPLVRTLLKTDTMPVAAASLVLMILNIGAASTSVHYLGEEAWKIYIATGYLNLFLSAVVVCVLADLRLDSRKARSTDKVLGDQSYPIYIFHWVGGLCVYYFLDLYGFAIDKPSVALAAGAVLLSIITWTAADQLGLRRIEDLRGLMRGGRTPGGMAATATQSH